MKTFLFVVSPQLNANKLKWFLFSLDKLNICFDFLFTISHFYLLLFSQLECIFVIFV